MGRRGGANPARRGLHLRAPLFGSDIGTRARPEFTGRPDEFIGLPDQPRTTQFAVDEILWIAANRGEAARLWSPRRRLVEASSSREPLHRLAGHACDGVEVPVVMKDRRAVHFGDRCDEQIRRRRAAMLAPLRKSLLNTRCGAFAAIVKVQMPDVGEVRGESAIVGRAAC